MAATTTGMDRDIKVYAEGLRITTAKAVAATQCGVAKSLQLQPPTSINCFQIQPRAILKTPNLNSVSKWGCQSKQFVPFWALTACAILSPNSHP